MSHRTRIKVSAQTANAVYYGTPEFKKMAAVTDVRNAIEKELVERIRDFQVYYTPKAGFTIPGTSEAIPETQVIAMLRRDFISRGCPYSGRVLGDAIREILQRLRRYMDTKYAEAVANPGSGGPGIVWLDEEGHRASLGQSI
jgi:hypothetical protein